MFIVMVSPLGGGAPLFWNKDHGTMVSPLLATVFPTSNEASRLFMEEMTKEHTKVIATDICASVIDVSLAARFRGM